jgi:hypothetical protein
MDIIRPSVFYLKHEMTEIAFCSLSGDTDCFNMNPAE